MNVVYSSSDSFAPIAGVSIMSLLHNNTDADEINIYMIDNNISDENKKRFENMVDKFGRNIVFILHFFIIAPKNTIKSVNLPIDKLGFIM